MKRLITALLFAVISIGAMAQTHSPAPDTIPDGGSRKLLREANNWNILENVWQADTLIEHLNRILALEASSVAGYWTKLGSDLIPLTTTDNILLDGDARVKFGATTYIAGLAGGTGIGFTAGSIPVGWFTASAFVMAHPLQFDDLDVSLYRNGNDLMLDDLNNTPISLSALIAGSGAYLAGSGLTLTGSTFDIFGDITKQTTITVDGSAYGFLIEGNAPTFPRSAQFSFENGEIKFASYAALEFAATNGYAEFKATGNQAIVQSINASFTPSSITVSNTSMAILDAINSKGLVNAADYRLQTTDRSLIDKAHIETLIAASPGTGYWTLNTPDIYFNTGDVGIGVTAPTGALDVVSTTGAFIPPRMTTAQRTALAAIEGSFVYDTDVDAHFSYRNSSWGQIASGTPVVGGDILLLKSDWRSFTFGLGNGNAADQALMIVGAPLGDRREGLGISVPERVDAWAKGASGDVTIQIYHATDPTGAGTPILTTPLNITTAGGYVSTTAFDVASFAKDDVFWAEITAKGATEPTFVRVYYSYSFQ